MNEPLYSTLSKGDPIQYRHLKGDVSQREHCDLATGIYLYHGTFKVDQAGTMIYHNITIIDKDGEKAIVNWVKPLNK